MLETIDYKCMARALQIARKGVYTSHPNPRVGCVLVRNGSIVGEGYHARTGEAHAEIRALEAAGEAARGAVAYVTLEPCCHFGRTPPCTKALIEAGVSRVVAAMGDPNPHVAGNGLKALSDAGVSVESGVMEAQAESLNPGYISRMRYGRPWIRLKLALSLDGRTAMASGESRWITGEDARRDVQLLRARSSAIMTGIGTVMTDDPSLNVRLRATELQHDGETRQPLRIVLDTHLRITPNAKVLNLPGDCLVYTASTNAVAIESLREIGAEVHTVGRDGQVLNLGEILRNLAEREINELHVEAGPTVGGALIEKRLINELVVYLAPHLMGDGARGLAHLPNITSIAQRVQLNIRDVRFVGSDLRLVTELKAMGAISDT